MWSNYLKVAWRNLRKDKTYASINIVGLALGLAVCVLILLFAQHELSFDRFHKNAERIFVVKAGRKWVSPPRLGKAMVDYFPEIAGVTAIDLESRRWLVTHGDKAFREDGFVYADEHIFDVFSFTAVRGDLQTALTEPYGVVISRAVAERYFGDQDPLGAVLHVDYKEFVADFKVTAVIENPPLNSDIRPNFLISHQTPLFFLNKEYFRAFIVALLAEGTSAAAVESKAHAFAQNRGQEDWGKLQLVPLNEVHAKLSPMRVVYLYVFSAVALLVVLLACANYMNLATARASGRAKEVGMRKVVGAQRRQLLGQFLGESVLLTGAAFVLALVLAEVLLPLFNTFLGAEIGMQWYLNGSLWLVLAGVTLLVGVLAGIYPALFLSGFHPIGVLKGTLRLGARGSVLRKGLVVFQFAVSIGLIVAVLVMYRQIDYVQTKDMGFDAEQVLVVPLEGVAAQEAELFHSQLFTSDKTFNLLKTELLKNPRISGVAGASTLPVSRGRRLGISGMLWAKFRDQQDQTIEVGTMQADADFLEVMGIDLVAGRSFADEFPEAILPKSGPIFQSDYREAVLVNEAAVRAFGWETPIGQRVNMGVKRENVSRVIGVVEDFHFYSLHYDVKPAMIQLAPNESALRFLVIRIDPRGVRETVAYVKEQLQIIDSGQPFEFYFLDEDIDAMYQQEMKMLQAFSTFSALAIFIACLGLLGLVAFMAEVRTKEIGIRKVLGATAADIAVLLSADFVKPVVIAHLVAWPVVYYAMGKWLSNFAYRIDLEAGVFVLGGALVLGAALATMGGKALKAAWTNPVDALRYE